MREIHHSYLTISREEDEVVLITELSDLPYRDWPTVQDRVWPDACDVGITVVGRLHRVDYVVVEENRLEGELRYYVLRPTPYSARRVPGCKNTKMVIYND